MVKTTKLYIWSIITLAGCCLFLPGLSAAECIWRLDGKIVDSIGQGIAMKKIRVESRHSSPPGLWNNYDWANPYTKDDGTFQSRSINIENKDCKRTRDIRIKISDLPNPPTNEWRVVGQKNDIEYQNKQDWVIHFGDLTDEHHNETQNASKSKKLDIRSSQEFPFDF